MTDVTPTADEPTPAEPTPEVAETPVAETPVAEEPVAEEPVAETPVAVPEPVAVEPEPVASELVAVEPEPVAESAPEPEPEPVAVEADPVAEATSEPATEPATEPTAEPEGAVAEPVPAAARLSRRKEKRPAPLTDSVGRRKEAVARLRIRAGSGTITINRRPIEAYFPTETHRMIVTEPLRLTTTNEVYDIDATIAGGGVSGQAGALRLGIARALVELDPEVRILLKRAGLLRRDDREKESKKYGLKKARKAPQYSKR
jgi:small subunit ribosomal protein S9